MNLAPSRRNNLPIIRREDGRHIFSAEAEQVFEVISRMVAECCDAAFGAVSLLHDNRLSLKSAYGLPHLAQLPHDAAFCLQAISRYGFVEIQDATIDKRFSAHPLVVEAPHIRYYVGMPVRDDDGHAQGVLWVMDFRPKRLSTAQRKMFERLAMTASSLFSCGRDIALDPVDITTREVSVLNLDRSARETQSVENENEGLENALALAQELTQAALSCVGDAIVAAGVDGRITHFNKVAERLTGWSIERACGELLEKVFRVVGDETRDSATNLIKRVQERGAGVELSSDTRLASISGIEHPIEGRAQPLLAPRGTLLGVAIVFRDVSARRDLAKQLSYQSRHDSLTGLFNRREFEIAASALLQDARTVHKSHALLYIDVDHFKVVNDTCGHLAGDQLLRHVAKALAGVLRGTDFLARLGGDEFGVLLEDCSVLQAKSIADALVRTVAAARFSWLEKNVVTGISVGLAEMTDQSCDLRELLSAADTACFIAKEKGRGRVQTFQTDDIEVLQRHAEMGWLSQISSALDENRFVLFCQKIVPTGSAQSRAEGTRYELLLRMKDRQGNIVPPSAFIPAAERYGLMLALDRWVVRNALQTLAAHMQRTERKQSAQYSINISGVSVGDECFQAFVTDLLRSSAVPPHLICFEITETAAIANLNRAGKFIREIRELGCRFALDDFGSGMCSFGYLKNLPIDYIKIDGSFVKGLDSNCVNHAMVEAINRIGHLMGLQTIAECVEDDATMAKLRELGVDYAQGYVVHIPESLDGVLRAASRVPSTFKSLPFMRAGRRLQVATVS
jgi:diguanylate cyclase (GGDEF)-like protein/PAS domain S-box-containing protein